MPAFSDHIFVCGNVRSPGHRRGCCDPEGADRLRNQLKLLVKSRGLGTRVRVNKAGCLDHCEHGPTMVIYPQGIWYGGVKEADLPRIVDETIVRGKILDDLLISDDCLCNPDCAHIRAMETTDAETPNEKAGES